MGSGTGCGSSGSCGTSAARPRPAPPVGRPGQLLHGPRSRRQRPAIGGNLAGGKAGNGPQWAASWTAAAANVQSFLNPESGVGYS